MVEPLSFAFQAHVYTLEWLGMKKKLVVIALTILIVFLTIFAIKNRQDAKTLGAVNQGKKEQEEDSIKIDPKKYQPQKTSQTDETALDLSAKSAIVVDQDTNEIIYQKNPHAKLPPASITKVLAFSVALEKFKKDDYITITQFASEQISNKINMKAGEKLKLDDLLYGLMMISANDAAYAIADASKGGFDTFVADMNKKSKKLGLTDSNFKNPAGLDDPDQYSSAFDMATYTRYALLEHPDFIKYAGKTKEHSVQMTENNEPHWWFGHLSAMLKRYPGMIAAKTGYTDDARSTYVGVAERNGRRLVVVLLGSDDANNDVPALLDYGFAN